MTDKTHYSTSFIAKAFGYHKTSVYNRLSRKGEFHGVTPIKHLNGRLEWPAEAVDALLEQQAQGAEK